VLQVPVWVDLASIVVGALAGAVSAARLRLDVIGVLFLAVVMGLGGGLLRDILLAVRPVALTSASYLPTAAVAALVGFFFAGALNRLNAALTLLDALALGLFMVVGVEKAEINGLGAPAAVFIGVAAATGGGLLRDVVANQPVTIVRRGPWNAAAALAGAVVYVALYALGAATIVCEAVAFGLCVLSRLVSVWRGWETPLPYDLTSAITRPLGSRRGRREPEN
jgi:uncharacterized membrane protein YeiH